MEKSHILLKDLEIYKLAREFSRDVWGIYIGFDWETKKVIGDQFMRAVDSVGANIAEGYARYHYLDRVKFLHISRASLAESLHWAELLLERGLITREMYEKLEKIGDILSIKIQNFITVIRNRAQQPKQ